MKKIFSLHILMFCAGFVFAQGQPNTVPAQTATQSPSNFRAMTAADRAKAQTQRLVQALGLQDELQIEEITAINLDRAQKMEAARNQAMGGDREAMRAHMQQLNQETDEKLKKVLTSTQFEQYVSKKDEINRRRPGNGNGEWQHRREVAE